MTKSLFITFEGGEGTGKSTLINHLAKHLQENTNYNIVVTREPGGTDIAEQIRKIIINNNLDLQTERLLFATARHHHVENIIKPLLTEDNNIILCDRYLYSSYVYQGLIHSDNDYQLTMDVNKNYPHPTLSFILDAPVEFTLERLKNNRKDKIDRFDSKGITYHDNIRKAFIKLANEFNNCHLLDCKQDTSRQIKTVYDTIKDVLS